MYASPKPPTYCDLKVIANQQPSTYDSFIFKCTQFWLSEVIITVQNTTGATAPVGYKSTGWLPFPPIHKQQ